MYLLFVPQENKTFSFHRSVEHEIAEMSYLGLAGFFQQYRQHKSCLELQPRDGLPTYKVRNNVHTLLLRMNYDQRNVEAKRRPDKKQASRRKVPRANFQLQGPFRELSLPRSATSQTGS